MARSPLLWTLVGAVSRPVIGASDTDQTVRRKRMLTPVIAVLVPILAAVLAAQRRVDLFVGSAVTALLAAIGAYVGWALRPSAPMHLWFLYGTIIAVVLGDMYGLAQGDRYWTSGILVMDLALVLEVPERHTAAMVITLLVYLTLAAADQGSTGLHRDFGPTPWVCDCGEPPCLQFWFGAAVQGVHIVFVFLCDLYLTRGFALGMRSQHAVIQTAIRVTQDIAEQLARYQTEEGRALLNGEEGAKLPPGLRQALMELLSTLDEFKPYVPDMMLMRGGGEEGTCVEPPGTGQESPVVTVCFTDIQSSTELWEFCPQGMHIALHLHNDVVRKVLRRCSGYEVKIIGDSFMLAFSEAENACRFAVEVQRALTDERWPSDLLQHPLCAPVHGDGFAHIWNGPRVRIGLHCGEVTLSINPVTGRCDYFGPSVNTAARVERAVEHGGLTGVTAAVLDSLETGALQRLGDPLLVCMGAKRLKGLRTMVEVTVMLDRTQAERKALIGTPAYVRQQSSRCSSAAERRRAASAMSLSSGSDSPTSPIHGMVRTRALRDGFLSRNGTCVCFRAKAVADLERQGCCVETMLEAVEQAADSTQGVVVGAVSVQCFVVWNGPRTCGDHYGQCLRATDSVRGLNCGIVAGACSGQLLHGVVTAGRKKHATVVGGSVELSAALAETAQRCGEGVLAAGVFGAFCESLSRTRRFTERAIHNSSTEELTVFTLTEGHSEGEWWAECGSLLAIRLSREEAGFAPASVGWDVDAIGTEPDRTEFGVCRRSIASVNAAGAVQQAPPV